MSPGTHERPPVRRGWRLGTAAVLVLGGSLFAVSAEQSDGTDLRAGRLTDLASVVTAERQRTNALTARAAELNEQVEDLSAGLGDRSVQRVRTEIETLLDPAGLTPQTGPAVRVTLTDAPPDAEIAEGGTPNDLVVHQQDIQAVANAMWSAGARAVTIQGQRLVSTTGIRCEGSIVTLQGVPYTPPYVIVGIGDVEAIHAALATDEAIAAYRDDAAAPGGGVGWQVEDLDEATAPAYEGLIDVSFATPMAG